MQHKGTWYILESDRKLDPEEVVKKCEKGEGQIVHNIITNTGLVEIAKRNIGTSTSTNNKLIIGSENTPTPMASDTAIASQTASVDITDRTIDGTTERYHVTVDTDTVGSNSKVIGTMGIAADTILFSRVIFSAPLTMISNRTYNITIFVAHTNN